MTTREVATYLGLAGPDSARGWLRRRGIAPVGREPGGAGQSLYPAAVVLDAPRRVRGRRRGPVYDPWRDVEGTPIPVGCRVEQVGVAKEHGALSCHRGAIGVVVGRPERGNRVRVRFDDQAGVVAIRPHLLRVADEIVTVARVIAELEALRDLVGIRE